MSDDIAISVENVSKAYRIWNDPAARLKAPLIGTVAQLLPRRSRARQALADREASYYRDFYALRDIAFQVRRGETVGIIGRNGSGKSTLLQIIAGTLQPTSGTVRVQGRVAALLELGSGFNPDFTGRENVYLNAAVLGLTRAETDARFDQIAAFADIGDFLDQPVKTYSSGMMMRLAFAVQIQADPDVMIIDEALGVGDEPFQRKCYGRIALMRERGVTIFFVSHSTGAVIELCRQVVLLDRGRQMMISEPKHAVLSYHQLCYAPEGDLERVRADILRQSQGGEVSPPARESAPAVQAEPKAEKGRAYFLETMQSTSRKEFPPRGGKIETIQILDQEAKPVNVLVKGDDYILRWRVRFTDTVHLVRFGWCAKTVAGTVISGAATHTVGAGFAGYGPGDEVEVDFNFRCLFNPGTYFLDATVRSRLREPDELLHTLIDVLMFKVQVTPHTHRNGFIDTSGEPAWSVKTVGAVREGASGIAS